MWRARLTRRFAALKWHHWMRLVAGLILADQAVGTLSALPSDTAIVVACIGALFAPVPSEKPKA